MAAPSSSSGNVSLPAACHLSKGVPSSTYGVQELMNRK